MISDNIEITVHIVNLVRALAMKQLINNTCQLKLQSGMFGVTSLFISYNIKVKCVCVRACVCVLLPVKILIYL